MDVRHPRRTALRTARRRAAGALTGLVAAALARDAAAEGLVREAVEGAAVEVTPTTTLRARGAWLEVPPCAAKKRTLQVDGAPVALPDGARRRFPLAPAREHDVSLVLAPSAYEGGNPCGGPLVVGALVARTTGLLELAFDAPPAARARGGGRAVVFVPPGHDETRPAAVLVGLHPWNGSAWTYAAYRELLEEAAARDVVLLLPSGLGNSLYVADAEDETWRALAALERALAVDPARVSIWGASMGGAGATTVAFHRPDRFAFVASFFGDSRYDLTTYVKSILHDEEGARRVNALDAVGSARHLDVRLVHGDADRVSPLRQSTLLDEALRARGYRVSFVRAPGRGHEGSLVREHVRDLVQRAAAARAPARPVRVTLESARDVDRSAYGVTLERLAPGKRALLDVEARDGKVIVHAAENVARVVLEPGALGLAPGAPTAVSPGGAPSAVPVVAR